MNKTISRVLLFVLGLTGLICSVYRINKYFDEINITKSETTIVIADEQVADENNVEFTVVEVENVKSVGSGYENVTTSNNYVVVTIRINNKGTEPYDVNGLRFLLVSNGKEYEYSNETLFSYDNYLYLDTINPGIVKEYTIVYETPDTTYESEYLLKINPCSIIDGECVYISMKQ